MEAETKIPELSGVVSPEEVQANSVRDLYLERNRLLNIIRKAYDRIDEINIEWKRYFEQSNKKVKTTSHRVRVVDGKRFRCKEGVRYAMVKVMSETIPMTPYAILEALAKENIFPRMHTIYQYLSARGKGCFERVKNTKGGLQGWICHKEKLVDETIKSDQE